MKELYYKIYRLYYKWFGKYPITDIGDIPWDIWKNLFQVGKIGYKFDYKPKHTEKTIEPLSYKDQYPNNVCVLATATGNKENDEGCILSFRGATIFAYLRGKIKGNGYTNAWTGQEIKLKDGIPEERLLPSLNLKWSQFCDPSLITPEIRENAAKHKSKSAWKVNNLGEFSQLIDEGRTVDCSLVWYSSYNNLRGKKEDCIIEVGKGVPIGGHMISGRGYCDIKYLEDGSIDTENSLVKILNSFGKNWGHNGWFYVRFKDAYHLFEDFGAFTDSDMPKDVGKFINQNSGKVCKLPASNVCYLIENGKKRRFKNDIALMSHGITTQDVVIDTEACLNEIEEVKPEITFWDGNFKTVYEFVRSVMVDENEEIKRQLKEELDILKNNF